MKQLALVFFTIVLISGAGKSQSVKAIPNGDFEKWDSAYFFDLDSPWVTNNTINVANFGKAGITKVTGKIGSAVHLQTIAIGTDTIPARMQIIVPGTKNARGISGYFRCNLAGNDQAIIQINLLQKGQGTEIMFPFSGSVNTFTAFNIPFSSIVGPDSVVIFVSSNNFNGPDIPGSKNSWLELDDLSFTGIGSGPQILNGGFDFWSVRTIDIPLDWKVYQRLSEAEIGVYRSKGHLERNYSLKLTGDYLRSIGPYGFKGSKDTLTGYYKYFTSVPDSGRLVVYSQKDGTRDYSETHWFGAVTSWQYFEIPFNIRLIPDSIQIDLTSTEIGNRSGSLYLDDLQLKSQPHTSAILPVSNSSSRITAFPNPTQNQLNIYFGSNAPSEFGVKIYNSEGRLMIEKEFNTGSSTVSLPIDQLSAGLYFYEVMLNGETIKNKFVKEK